MTKKSTSDSYIIRIYRTDSADPHQLTGQVEALDGSGKRTAFTHSDELIMHLNPGRQKLVGRKRP